MDLDLDGDDDGDDNLFFLGQIFFNSNFNQFNRSSDLTFPLLNLAAGSKLY